MVLSSLQKMQLKLKGFFKEIPKRMITRPNFAFNQQLIVQILTGFSQSAKVAWDILVKFYEGDEKIKSVKLLSLCRQYELLKMGKWESSRICVQDSKSCSFDEECWWNYYREDDHWEIYENLDSSLWSCHCSYSRIG